MLDDEERAGRDALANAAKAGDWNLVLTVLRDHPEWINASRPGSKSEFTPLHQAAYNGAPASVVDSLIAMVAWRILRTTKGELPVDLATRREHDKLIGLLTPRPLAVIDTDELRAMEQ